MSYSIRHYIDLVKEAKLDEIGPVGNNPYAAGRTNHPILPSQVYRAQAQRNAGLPPDEGGTSSAGTAARDKAGNPIGKGDRLMLPDGRVLKVISVSNVAGGPQIGGLILAGQGKGNSLTLAGAQIASSSKVNVTA